MKEVTFLLPVFNKEKTIGLILKKIGNAYPNSKIIVIDNNSSDRTAQIARNSGALVLQEEKYGKYHAIKKGFKNIKTQFVVLLDAEEIHYPEEIKKLIKNLFKDKDIALGSRLSKRMTPMTKFNLLNYYFFQLISSLLYYNTSEVFTGYWAFKRNFIEYIINSDIESTGFEGEAQMFSLIFEGSFKIVEVPLKGAADPFKLNQTHEGGKIYKTITGLIKSH